MVTFELINADRLEYAYFPEGKGHAGYFVLSNSGEILNFTESPEDKFRDYLNMAVYELRDLLEENGRFPEKGMNAWY